ncbi:MAG: hypothetical protein K6G44_08160 [Lentisphaeria bacterium]|nr:hypothetical protein [Lentisphaeria bacterium]
MKKQTLANIAVVAAFLFTLNLAAQPRGPQNDKEFPPGGKGAPAAKPAPKPAGPVAKPAQPAPKPQPAAPNPAAEPRRGIVVKTGPVINPTPMGKTDPVTYRGEPKHGGKPVTVVAPGPNHGPAPHANPAPAPTHGPAAHPAPGPGPVVGPKPGPAPHVHPALGPDPVVGPKPGPAPHVDHHHGGHNHSGFFFRLFEPAPPRPRGYRTFPHRHPSSKFTFIWYDYLPGGRVYEIKDYVIYECRFCHLVQYSPVIPENALCPAVPGQIHSYQILGYYGDLAFRCATCGVTVNSTTVPNVGWCGPQYHVWQQLIEY